MDSIKSFKGYGKVDETENREFRRKTRKRLIIIASSVILLLILIAVAIAVVVHKNSTDGSSSSSPNSSQLTSSTSIKAMCSVTRYPDSCFSSISSLKGSNLTTDPEELFKLSLHVASAALSKLSSLPDAFKIPPNDKRLELALRDCKDLFDDAVYRLNDSLATLSTRDASDQKMVTESKVSDLKSWLSAAVTDLETCLDGFDGTTGGFREKFEPAMANATQFTSNSLAIVAGIFGILRDLDLPIHRKLLADHPPNWVSGLQRRVLTSKLEANVTVAADGSGQVKTIKEAVDLVPKRNLYPFVIYVKEGEYEENVVVEKSKWNVIVRGDGMYKSVVTGSLNFVDGTPTFSTATFAAVGMGFMAQDMGFKNTAGPNKHQAVALRVGSDRSVFHRCSFDAYQDTLYAHALRQFYRECDVAGTVDFIFGDASVVFQKCTIRPRQPLPNQQNIITAQGRKDPNESTGISIQACTISPYDNVTARTYLGRPWKPYATTVVMKSEIGALVDPSGWLSWEPGTAPPDTINYAEFQNTGPGSRLAARVTWPGYKPAISEEEAAKYTVESFLQGSEWISQAGVLFESSL